MSEMPTIFWYKTQNSDEFGKQWNFFLGGGSRLDNLDKQEKNAIESSLLKIVKAAAKCPHGLW